MKGMSTLFAVHHAGGSGHAFLPWRQHLPGVDLVPVTLPGRMWDEDGSGCADLESAAAWVADLVEQRRQDLGQAGESVVLGHSMGALVAYEAGRTLLSRSPSAVQALVVSGMAAPPRVRSPRRRDLLSAPDLVEALIAMGGLDQDSAADERLAPFLPQIRHDLRLVDSYRWSPGPPLELPTFVYRGADDPAVSGADAEGWNQVVTPVRHRTFPGGHFYLKDAAAICRALGSDLGLGQYAAA